VYLATAMSTLRTKVRRFSFVGMLVSESLTLATFSCHSPGEIIILMAAGMIPCLWELKERGKPMRVFALHMGLCVILLATGWSLSRDPHASMYPVGIFLLVAGALLRSGSVPVHSWMPDLFEHASFGAALLFVTPMVGAYATVRLILPIAPDWAIHLIAVASLVTSVYAAGMAIVQKEARRFFCYLLLSHSSLILVGLATVTKIGLTGALAVWLSDSLAMAGFGLTLRSMESRLGRISLASYHGMYEHTPTLAVFFLLTGLASIGFPGAFGFIGMELLVRGAVDTYPYVGAVVVVAAALNGIAIMAAYFRLFTGVRHVASIPLAMRGTERIAVLTLATLIIAGGLFPQTSIRSRYAAADQLVELREAVLQHERPGQDPHPAARQPEEVATAEPTQ
ncbi:MAG TPA: proton-conducting transporter membrane subunit, partial [Caulifigura sp.]|nr:proton-conducting transporter membrane subunit [Caulifigura sp.]